MLDQTFTVPLAPDLAAVAVGSLQGGLFAAGFKRLDLLGVAIVGIATGIGGGFLRDILLGVTPAAFSNNAYLLTATISALVGMLLLRLFERVDWLVTSLDALSIGLYGAIGTTKALSMGLPVVPALFVGTVSAVGGGFVRDLLLNIPIAVMHVGSFYAMAAMGGILVLLVALALGLPVLAAAIACVVVSTVLRLFAVRFGWSLPEQRALSRLRLRRRRQVEAAIDEALHTGAITLPDLPADEGGRDDTSGDDGRDLGNGNSGGTGRDGRPD
ncbi:trimeric intracellular cation channel family protein [Leucobacter soli]|uniref:trimeric intracellular cation channel family protein n=2 Tax=Leucobacter soli TaxID=2812850 RepID=UPI001F2A7BA7|nr:TRIC cation channel family protein [Leucobacter soli]